jgi:hypothetical protein
MSQHVARKAGCTRRLESQCTPRAGAGSRQQNATAQGFTAEPKAPLTGAESICRNADATHEHAAKQNQNGKKRKQRARARRMSMGGKWPGHGARLVGR